MDWALGLLHLAYGIRMSGEEEWGFFPACAIVVGWIIIIDRFAIMGSATNFYQPFSWLADALLADEKSTTIVNDVFLFLKLTTSLVRKIKY